jgi:hypothetical protein
MDALLDFKITSSVDHFAWYLVNASFILFGDLIPPWAQVPAAASILLQIYQLYSDVFRVFTKIDLIQGPVNPQLVALLVWVSVYYYLKAIIPRKKCQQFDPDIPY